MKSAFYRGRQLCARRHTVAKTCWVCYYISKLCSTAIFWNKYIVFYGNIKRYWETFKIYSVYSKSFIIVWYVRQHWFYFFLVANFEIFNSTIMTIIQVIRFVRWIVMIPVYMCIANDPVSLLLLIMWFFGIFLDLYLLVEFTSKSKRSVI